MNLSFTLSPATLVLVPFLRKWFQYFRYVSMLFLGVAIQPHSVLSQIPSSLKITFYGDIYGHSIQHVNCIAEDHLGYIWIGTRNGLFRFDGVTYTAFYESCTEAEGLPGGTVFALAEDWKHRLWVATLAGLCWIDTEDYSIHWFDHPALMNTQVNAIELEGMKHIWVGRTDSIFAIDLDSYKTTGFQARRPEEPWGSNYTEDLLLYKDSLLLACGHGAITQIDVNTFQSERILSGKGYNLCIYPYKSDQLIVSNYFENSYVFDMSSRKAISRVVGHIDQNAEGAKDCFFSIIRKTIPGQSSFYLAGGVKGIALLHEDPLHYGKSHDCVSGKEIIEHPNATYEFIESRDGNIWGASSKGFFKIDFQHPYFNSHQIGRALFVASDPALESIIWIINYAGEISAIDLRQDSIVYTFSIKDKINKGKNEHFMTAYQSNDYQLWLGTEQGNVFSFNLQTHVCHRFPVHESFPGVDLIITGISTLDSKEIWISSSSGLIKMNDQNADPEYEIFTNDLITGINKDLSEPQVYQDSKGRIWIIPTFNNPVLFIPGDTVFKSIPVINCLGQPFNPPRPGSLTETADHQLWLVSNNAPLQLDEENLVFEYKDFGFDNPELENMIWLPDGNLFAAISDRLCIWHPQSATIQTFTSQEGWPGGDCTGIGALLGRTMMYALDSDGNIFLFEPEDLKQQQFESPIRLTEFNILNKGKSINPIRVHDAKLAYNENNIRFSFRALNYADPIYMNYSFMLEGMEDSWNMGEQSNSAIYTNLPDGDFTFWVKAKTIGESWSAPVALAAFSIATPFWRMAWFRLLVFAVIAGSIYALYQYRVNNLKRMLRVRTKISSDLHDDIGSTLTSIRVYSEMARKQVPNEQLDTILTKIEENAGDMIQSMSDIVWTINPKYDDFTYVIQRMENFASNFLSLKEIQYSIAKENKVEDLRLDMEKRKNLFLIYKEALHNAAKHSGCQRVDIRLMNGGKTLDMRIDDDGVGFNGSPQNGNGLSNMRDRANEVGGSFHVESQPGRGTSISVSIPL